VQTPFNERLTGRAKSIGHLFLGPIYSLQLEVADRTMCVPFTTFSLLNKKEDRRWVFSTGSLSGSLPDGSRAS
jgi:hypothetical protein